MTTKSNTNIKAPSDQDNITNLQSKLNDKEIKLIANRNTHDLTSVFCLHHISQSIGHVN
eukprot:GAHX01006280.1.p1 GENE.GAHX01006280.1~~GAHX01006280.1.p1  ORF type:complete len:59 (-),score=7.12 GAHX01006280.1:46-222(-)